MTIVNTNSLKLLIFVFLFFWFGVREWFHSIWTDLDRNSVKNRGSNVSGALMATPFVPKLIFLEFAAKKKSDREALREGLPRQEISGEFPG